MVVTNDVYLEETIPIPLYKARYENPQVKTYAVLGNIGFPNCVYYEPLSFWDIDRILNSYHIWDHDAGVVKFSWTGKGYCIHELEKDIYIAFNPEDNKRALRRKTSTKYDFNGIKVSATYIIFKCDIDGNYDDIPSEIVDKYSCCEIKEETKNK